MLDTTDQLALAQIWRKILSADPIEIFGAEAGRLQNRSWGDQLPQPGYVGSAYRPGGLAFISMNPGGGRGDGLGAADLLQYEALRQLRDCPEAEIARRFAALMEVLRRIMPTWTIVQRFVDPILAQTSLDFFSIAYFNLLKWRTSQSNGLSRLYDLSWHHHTAAQIQLLAPSIVIAVGVDAGKAFRRHHTELLYFDVIPRVIGNNIGEPGKEAIRRICRWLAEHPVSGP